MVLLAVPALLYRRPGDPVRNRRTGCLTIPSNFGKFEAFPKPVLREGYVELASCLMQRVVILGMPVLDDQPIGYTPVSA